MKASRRKWLALASKVTLIEPGAYPSLSACRRATTSAISLGTHRLIFL
jgi:hypothetical protein